MMNNKNLILLTVLAGVGVTGCSQTPRAIPEADALQGSAPVRAPYNQQVARAPVPQPPLAQLPRVASPYQQRIPAAQPYPPARQLRPNGYNRNAGIPSIPAYGPQPVAQNQTTGMPRLARAELRAIGEQIFNNEGGGNLNNLAHWNDGEDFASMGIGHFTWYPAGRRQSFGNTFPGLLDYMVQHGVQLPGWLQQARHTGAPWRSRGEFLQAKNSQQVQQLQHLLYNTRELQAQYIVDRARRAMPKLVKASSGQMQSHVARNLNAVANTPGGWYALIDYVNFKGEGLGNGGYKGQSWGLRQVLEEMRPAQPGRQALHEFADAAMRVLHRRVQNSDPSRNEARWLRGWQNRVDTYRNPIV